MPSSAPRPCTHPGCKALVTSGSRCPAHPYAKRRSSRTSEYKKLYDTQRWRRGRAAYLKRNPLCNICALSGRTTQAKVVDHITPHRGDRELFFNQDNWQPLCKACHDRKTATSDGGFGNK